jgi:hypothetical protein
VVIQVVSVDHMLLVVAVPGAQVALAAVVADLVVLDTHGQLQG